MNNFIAKLFAFEEIFNFFNSSLRPSIGKRLQKFIIAVYVNYFTLINRFVSLSIQHSMPKKIFHFESITKSSDITWTDAQQTIETNWIDFFPCTQGESLPGLPTVYNRVINLYGVWKHRKIL